MHLQALTCISLCAFKVNKDKSGIKQINSSAVPPNNETFI